MRILFHQHACASGLLICLLSSLVPVTHAQMASAPAAVSTAPGLLSKDQTLRLVPPSVYFSGQVASTQARNSGAVRLPGGPLVVATLVDTSGYSSSVQEKYQAYLITEAALLMDGHILPAGAYGCGFLADNTFIVMDVGGTTLLTAHSIHDAEMRRPTPLQILAGPDKGSYRLYEGRSFISLQAARP